jgi:8-oxo-dGTP pyrophosphatase MutT (NUDIX family)
VEGEESLWEAAKRELFEETGFSPTNLVQIGYSYALPMQDEWRKFYANGVQSITEHVFLAIIEGEQKPAITDEHDTWMWCSLTGALKKLQWPEYIQALKRCDLAVKSRF